MIIVRAKDIKEYFYCPRVIYFERVLKIKIPTEHLERGRRLHRRVWSAKKEIVRKDDDIEEIYEAGVELYDKELGLSGKLDFLKIVKKNNEIVEAVPIEIKLGPKKTIEFHHKMQLVAYALLVRKILGYKVNRVGVYYADKRIYLEEEISPEDISLVRNAIEDIRMIIKKGIMPNPTRQQSKCNACQYFNFCMGI